MRVTVQYYGFLKTLAGRASDDVELEAACATAADCLIAVAAKLHAGRERFDSVAVAVGDELVARTHPLCDGDVVALLPPVSGG